jgi:hypothetical protein
MRRELFSLFVAYCLAVQAAIYAGADVRTTLDGREVGVLVVAAKDAETMHVVYSTHESPEQHEAYISPLTELRVKFSDV